MTIIRAHVLRLAAVTLAALAVPGIGSAQTYPSRPVRIVLSLPPGGTPDVLARILGNKLTEQTGQPVIVDSRPGASGVMAVEIAKAAPPDGYTLLLAGTTNFATLPALKPKLSYNIDNDFLALSRVASVANVVAVHPSLGVSTVADLVKLAKARPGQLNYGSGGNGSAPHLAGEMFNVLAGVRAVHVPYKGSVLAVNDLITGQLQFIMTSPVTVMPHWKSGRIKVIATTGPKRDPLFPELPTVADTVAGFESTLWWGVAVPAKTPAGIVKKLHTEIVKALQSSEVREPFAKQGATAQAESPAEFAAFIRAERERIARIGQQVGITLD
ncbi:MAG TPA: tripartite tricarboxylate transporter substrate binding protein [Burkholderiales bacterium]|nr:tripartite tricarboxylate transporter substrate binding protein [Burkholderiales bacterium]